MTQMRSGDAHYCVFLIYHCMLVSMSALKLSFICIKKKNAHVASDDSTLSFQRLKGLPKYARPKLHRLHHIGQFASCSTVVSNTHICIQYPI